MPNGCSDDLLPWRRTADRKLDTKYPYGRRAWHPVLLRSESVFPLLSQQQLGRKKETLLNDPNFLSWSLKFQREPVSGRDPGGGTQPGPEGRGSVACVGQVCFHGEPPAVPARALVVASVPRAAPLGRTVHPGRTVHDDPAGWKQSQLRRHGRGLALGRSRAWGGGRCCGLLLSWGLRSPRVAVVRAQARWVGPGPLGLAVCFACLN